MTTVLSQPGRYDMRALDARLRFEASNNLGQQFEWRRVAVASVKAGIFGATSSASGTAAMCPAGREDHLVMRKMGDFQRLTDRPGWDMGEGERIPTALWQRARDYFVQAYRVLRLVARFGPAIDGTIHLSWVSPAGDKEFQIEVGSQGDFWSEWKGGYEYSGGVTGDQKEFRSRIRKYFAN